MNTHVLGGAFVPHAPQFFTMPDTEDVATVERVRTVAAQIGAALAALKPDVWIIIANDHVNQFFLHCTPPFTLHMGAQVKGTFGGRSFQYTVASDPSLALIRYLQSEGFDPAFTSSAEIDYAFGIPLAHLSVTAPIVPIYANAYVPPQPTMERCYAFGQALARGLAAIDVRAVIIASGGMSHFPGTDRYSNPDLEFDKSLLEPLRLGRLKTLLSLDEKRLDDTGNVELRCWAIGAGALGERVPDVVQLDPSWHHIYGTLGWFTPEHVDIHAPHYPAVRADRTRYIRRRSGCLCRGSRTQSGRDHRTCEPQHGPHACAWNSPDGAVPDPDADRPREGKSGLTAANSGLPA